MSDVVELRASAAHYRRWLKGRIAAGIALVAVLVGLNLRRAESWTEVAILLAILVGSPVVTLACIAIHVRTSRVRLGDGEVEYTRWFRRRTTLRRADGLVGLLAVYSPKLTTGQGTRLLVIRGEDGGPRIRLSAAHWTDADLEAIARHAGVLVRDRTFDVTGFERRAPGAMPWRERHWVAFGTLGALVITAVVAAAVVGYWKLDGRPPFDEQPPRGISASSLAQQDAVVRDVAAALGGRWQAPVEDLTACQDEDDYRGWERRLEVVGDGSGLVDGATELTPALAEQVEAAIVANGYVHADGNEFRGVKGRLDADRYTEDVVEMRMDAGRAVITVVGHCEVPGR